MIEEIKLILDPPLIIYPIVVEWTEGFEEFTSRRMTEEEFKEKNYPDYYRR